MGSGKDMTAVIKAAAEANRKARAEREANGIYRAVFMRLFLTDDAYAATKNMSNKEFREFVSEAVRRAADKAKQN